MARGRILRFLSQGGTRMLLSRLRRTNCVLAFVALGGIAAPGAYCADYRHFNWEEVAKGVWYGTTLPNSFQTGNVVIVSLPSGGSLVVDSQNSPFLGREVVEKAKEVTKGPVRYLVNTHHHQDHVGGNAAFRKEFPRIEIIAHKNTCNGIPEKIIPRMRVRLDPMRRQLGDMKQKRTAMAAEDKEAAAFDRRIAGTELYVKDAEQFQWEPPTTCLDLKPGQARVITDGGRRIEIRYFGRAHTAGDLVVFLPKEKILAMGDLWSENGDVLLDSGLDGRDGSVLEAPETQKAIRKLDFDMALPGHRAIIRGKASLDAAIATGEKFVAQIQQSAERGEYVEEAMKSIPAPSPQLAAAWQRAVVRGFEELDLRRQLGLKLP
jgi:glyoxylase-like metal-dependent hydrolase (beta-lactamase superfamily II)